jgi:hypothetical protein
VACREGRVRFEFVPGGPVLGVPYIAEVFMIDIAESTDDPELVVVDLGDAPHSGRPGGVFRDAGPGFAIFGRPDVVQGGVIGISLFRRVVRFDDSPTNDPQFAVE